MREHSSRKEKVSRHESTKAEMDRIWQHMGTLSSKGSEKATPAQFAFGSHGSNSFAGGTPAPNVSGDGKPEWWFRAKSADPGRMARSVCVSRLSTRMGWNVAPETKS